MLALLGAALAQALHLAAMLAAAPLLAGLLRTAAARLAGRPEPHPLQLWHELRKLLRKRTVAAEGASPVALAAPHAAVVATALAAALVPSFALGMLFAPLADLLLLIGLLMLAQLARALAAIDTGGAVGGLHAAQALAGFVPTLPTLLLAAMGLAMLTGTTGLDGVIGAIREGGTTAFRLLPLGLILLALIGAALAETARRPLGDADAPAEEPDLAGGGAMPRDASGRHLALWEFHAALRLTVWLSLLAALALPFGLAPAGAGPFAWLVGLLAWVAKLLGLGLGLVLWEAAASRPSAPRAREFRAAALLLALLGVVLAFASAGRM